MSHLAGVNRPEHDKEFSLGNVSYLDHVLDILTRNKKSRRYYYRLSTTQDNPYGESKLQGEQLLREYSERVWQYGLYLSMAKFIRCGVSRIITQ